MEKSCKISLVQSVMDELSTISYMANLNQKKQSIIIIRALLNSFELSKNPLQSDLTIYSIKLLIYVSNQGINKVLTGVAELTEKALTELHSSTH